MGRPKDITGEQPQPLPGRDWILLPLLGLLTAILLVGSLELAARRIFTATKVGAERCLIFNDPQTGVRGRPNCTCTEKKYENQPVAYHFNDSGFRSDVAFVPKQAGAYRIVLIGSSFAMGAEVNREQSFAALLPGELTRRTGRPVELYNEAIEGWGGTPRNLDLRFNQVLAAQPDLILWVLTPGDLSRVSEIMPVEGSAAAPAQPAPRMRLSPRKLVTGFADLLDRSRIAVLVRHILYQSGSLYQKSSPGTEGTGAQGDRQRQLQTLAGYAADMETRARAAGVPLVATFLPNGELATQLSMGQNMETWSGTNDPYTFDHQLQPIIVNHGGSYRSILPAYRTLRFAERGYYPVSGHLNAEGNAVVAGLLADALAASPAMIPGTEEQGR